MDVHGKDNLIEKSCFTTRKRAFGWTLISLDNFSGFQEICTCDHCLDAITCENFNDSDQEIEHVGSNAGDIYGRRSYLPWGSSPT